MEVIGKIKELVTKHQAVLMIGVLLIVAAFLRLPQLNETPPWYTDEGFYLQMSWNVAHGQLQTFGIGDWSFISPLFTVPPVFLGFVGIFLILFGKTFIVLRILMVIFSLATIVSLWWIGSRWYSKWIALLPAAAYTVIPVIIINNRWGFPQNAAGFFLLWAFYFLIEYTKKDKRSALVYSLLFYFFAIGTTYWAGFFIVAYIVACIGKMKWRTVYVVALALAPMLLILGIRALTIPDVFIHDVKNLFVAEATYVQNVPEAKQTSSALFVLLTSIYKFFRINVLFVLSAAGLFFLKDSMIRKLLWITLITIAIPVFIFRSTPEGWFYPALTFTPLLLLGFSGFQFTLKKVSIVNVSKMCLIALVAVYICYLSMFSARNLFSETLTKHVTFKEAVFIYAPSTDEMEQIVQFIEDSTSSDDFIIAPHIIGAQIDVRYATPDWVACYENRDAFEMFPDSRFLYPMGIENASWFIQDTYFPGDVSYCGRFRNTVYQKLQEQQWPLDFQTTRFQVLRNPNPQ